MNIQCMSSQFCIHLDLVLETFLPKIDHPPFFSGRGARTKTIRQAESKPFAGGLIGGESAFAGQDFNFDPLGLSVKCEKYLPWFREVLYLKLEKKTHILKDFLHHFYKCFLGPIFHQAELKHGRIAMLAFLGLVVPEFARIPGPEAGATSFDKHSLEKCVGIFTCMNLVLISRIHNFKG